AAAGRRRWVRSWRHFQTFCRRRQSSRRPPADCYGMREGSGMRRWRWALAGLGLVCGCQTVEPRVAAPPEQTRAQSPEPAPPRPAPAPQVLPVGLDAVLRLAEGLDPEAALARGRLAQVCA